MAVRLRRRLAVAFSTSLVLIAGCGDTGGPRSEVASGGEPTPSPISTATSAPTTAPTEEPIPTESPDRPRPVYYVGDTPRGPALFRYFEPNTTGEPDHGSGRVIGLLMATPSDPDYRTLWPMGSLESLELDGDVAMVDLRDGSVHDRPASMTEREAELAVQQVVYTVQAAAQSEVAVQFRLDGNPVDQVFGVPTSEPSARAQQLDVLALVNITDPAEGQLVEDGFTADGVASSFEGSVPWELRDPAGTTVLRGSGQGSMEDRLTPWSTGPIDVSGLAPGTYTFVASTDDPTGGTEGPGPTVDTRTVKVR